MDLKRLSYFVSIAEHRGFAAAARARYISQSALSRQVQLLEEEIGARLLERGARGVVMTAAGEILLERAARLFKEVGQMKEDVLAESAAPAGRLTLGMTPSMRAILGGNLVEGFLRRFPAVHLGVIEGLSHAMADALTRGLCDVAIFVRDDAKGRAFSTRTLIREPLVVAGQSGAGLRMNEPVDVGWVAQYPLIVSRSNRVGSGLEKEANRIGKPLNIIIDVQPLHLSIDLVCRGVAYMVVPFSAAVSEYEAGFLSMAPIKGFDTGWVVAWPSDRQVSAASRRLIESIQVEFAKLGLEESLRRATGHPVAPARTRVTRS